MADGGSQPTPPNPHSTKVEQLRKEVHFLKSLLSTAKTVDGFVATARAAVKMTARVTKELQSSAVMREVVVTVRNLPKAWSWMRVKELLEELGVRSLKVDKAPDWELAIITLTDMNGQVSVMQKVPGHEVEGQALVVTAGPPSAEEMALQQQAARSSKRTQVAVVGVAVKKRRSHQRAQVLAGASRLPSSVCHVVCPWFERPYPTQLEDKRGLLLQALGAVSAEAAKRYSAAAGPCPAWLRLQPRGSGQARGAEGGSWGTEDVEVLCSPSIEGYRNRSEMAVGLDSSEKRVEVGFLLGATADGITAVADPGPTRHTSPSAKAVAHAVRDFINLHSNLPAWDKRSNPSNGFWRLVTVREGRRCTFLPAPRAPAAASLQLPPEPLTLSSLDPSQYMMATEQQGHDRQTLPLCSEEEAEAPPPDEVAVTIQVNPEFTDKVVMMAEAASLAAYLQQQASAHGLPLTALLLQLHSGLSVAAPADAPLLSLLDVDNSLEGMEVEQQQQLGHIQDAVCDLTLRIPHGVFFQVNTAATCLTCKLVGDWLTDPHPAADGEAGAADAAPQTLLLDICCGVGTFGLALAQRFSSVVGVDSSERCIAAARENAELNGLTNCSFAAGKVDQVLPQLLSSLAPQYDRVVAVLDPPHPGLSSLTLQLLLECPKITHLAYVSCNLDALTSNITDLCAPNRPPSAQGGGSARQRQGSSAAAPAPQPVQSAAPRFSPLKAAAVDICPHTAQLQAVLLLGR